MKRFCQSCKFKKHFLEFRSIQRGPFRHRSQSCLECEAKRKPVYKVARAKELALIPDPFEKKKSGPVTIISTEFLWSACI